MKNIRKANFFLTQNPMAMNTIRLHPLILLPPVLAAGAFALVNFFLRRRKDRTRVKHDIFY
ncbi:hypothetical protein Clim_0906 [Chlorobium limicola DSM 245]|uniref:Uncharacterized protein n=1 Tax=Chlorobium limicola (strain DSM 245 / NBRC 103803 / 6330) TaxID=290315 RepID=B3EIP4_CHLL2|nr:hypothetical protein [Chlorobium limicola]ACD89985.1 hypothetical protein Clim_0906 [Chlorobium limicola DSM 245]